jgi:hypothetical protein
VLKVLIGYLTYADPKKPARPVWAPPKKLAADLGLATTRGGVNRVRSSVRELVRLGYLIQTSPKHRKLTLVLYPVLMAASASELETRCIEFENASASEVGAPVHRNRVHSASEVGAPNVTDHLNRPSEQTKTDQTSAPAPVSSVSGDGLGKGNDGNGRRPQHPQADRPEMGDAWEKAKAHGVTLEGFIAATDARCDLSAVEIHSEVCKWAMRYPNASKPDGSLAGWLRKARGSGPEPRPGDVDGWPLHGEPPTEREQARARAKQVCDSW